MAIQLIVVIIIAAAEKEVISAAFCTKMASCKKVTAIFADFIETDRTFKHPALIF
jgi:hypothetical protein